MITTVPAWATVPLRLALGLIFLAHGAQKVLGAFGGPGLISFSSHPAPFGLWPSWLWMGAIAIAEFAGGLLVLLGLFTRPAAGAIVLTLAVSLADNPWGAFFVQKGGVEFHLALLAIGIALIYLGGGKLSVDANLKV